jgi:hypothetical protein
MTSHTTSNTATLFVARGICGQPIDYRRPCHSHWITIWTQLTRKLHSSDFEYKFFICKKENEAIGGCDQSIGSHGNFLLEEFVHQHENDRMRISVDKVHEMDIHGIFKDGLDVNRTLDCEVLNIGPCRG